MAANKKIPAIRFKGFEEGWEEKKLEEIGEIIGGGTPSTLNKEFWNGTIDWYSPTEIGDEVYAIGSKKRITQLGLEKSSATILPANRTILFTSRAGIGDMAILKSPGATNQGFQSLVLGDKHDTYFFYSMGRLIKNFALKYSTGSTFLEISGKTLGKMPIIIPNQTEQIQIGNYFKELDDLIQLQEQKLKKVINLKKAMLAKMFPQESADVPEIRFKGFREKWVKKKLADLGTIGDINHYMPNSMTDGIPYLMTGDFIGINDLNFKNVKLISEHDYQELSKKIKPELGDILIARYASVGAVRYVNFSKKFLISYSCAILKPGTLVDGLFLFFYLQGIEAQNQIEQEINTGSQRNIGIDSLKGLRVYLPLTAEQQKIGKYFQNLDQLINQSQQKITQLKHLKQALLQKMFI